ncbi:uncharacterized protein LOC123274835 isoform X2 [Cotesia glomerata]|uniref:uncharacterized protein LOC123274835 isoform X2 n=1 Tax=Cotesia glomerata TaxID=32391 RepID=UPI001D0230B7|nr:uncharacterized protein LOC123274835 isoform X2 [Cotesia glomerata]
MEQLSIRGRMVAETKTFLILNSKRGYAINGDPDTLLTMKGRVTPSITICGHFLVDVRKIHNFIAENPIEIVIFRFSEFVVGEHITDCTMCEQSMTNHICQPCNHWFGCSRCVQNMRVFLARVQPNLRCPTCDNVIASFEKIF